MFNWNGFACDGQMCLDDYFRKEERVVEPIERERAKTFVESIHYSRLLPNNTVYTFGLYKGGGATRCSILWYSSFTFLVRRYGW